MELQTTVTVADRSYEVRWHLHGDVTFCTIMWQNEENRTKGVLGVAVRNPADEPNWERGMRLSAKRACGIMVSDRDSWSCETYARNALGMAAPTVYSQIRLWFASEF
jgi:hypothetical protein